MANEQQAAEQRATEKGGTEKRAAEPPLAELRGQPKPATIRRDLGASVLEEEFPRIAADGGAARDRMPEPPAGIRELDFAALSGGANEIWIRWEGQLYRLRRTRNGKLLLTK